MKICSVCQRCYEDDAANCVENHGILIAEPQVSGAVIKNFRLDSLLERDAVGESFLATHTVLDRQFVIKIINQNSIGNAGEQACRRLGYEAQAAVTLRHPNITRVYEFGALDDGGFYTVTEFSGGRSLQEYMRCEGSLSETNSATIAEQAAAALIAAHDAGIVHRAVSPANIILSRDENDKISVKLQNFDLGGIREKALAADANRGAGVERLRYLSPEQCDGQTSDRQTDVYSLGIVFYEMLCGRSPFAAPTSAAISERKIIEEPLSQLRFETRALFAHTIKDALQRRPAARLQPDNFARQLRHIAQVLFHLGDVYSGRSRLLLPVVLSADSAEFDGSEVFDSAPLPASAASPEGAQTPIETAAPVEIETAPANPANPTDEQFAEEKVEIIAPENTPENIAVNTADEISPIIESAQIFVAKKKPDTHSSEFASDSGEAQIAESDAFVSKPLLVRKRQLAESSSTVVSGLSDDRIPQADSFISERIPVKQKQNDENSLKFISDSADEQTAGADSFVSQPIPVNKRPIADDLFKTGSLKNSNSSAAENLKFDENEANDKPAFDAPTPILVERKQSFGNSFDGGDSEPITVVRKKSNAVPIAPEIFDAVRGNVETARKTETAVPDFVNYPGVNPPPRRAVPAKRSAFAAGIGLLGLLLVSLFLGAFLYNRNQPEQPVISETTPPSAAPPVSPAPQDSPELSETKNETAEKLPPAAPETTTSAPDAKIPAPTISEKTSVTTPDERAGQTPPAESAKPVAPIREQAVSVEPETEADGKPQAELNNALNELISATNSGNVEQQMNYYAPKLDAYYLSRNASQNAVRAEKSRVFSRADEVAIQTGKPDIKLSPDGRRATMRFRKKYAIKQGQKNRSGEVVQELQWIKSGDDWRIVSERDVKVINR